MVYFLVYHLVTIIYINIRRRSVFICNKIEAHDLRPGLPKRNFEKIYIYYGIYFFS